MDENFDLSAEIQEAAEPVEEVSNIAEASEKDLSAERQEAAEPAQSTRSDADRAFADMRRRWQSAEAEREIAAERADRARDILERMGFTGGDANSVFDAADAHLTGQSVNDIRNERESREKTEREMRAARAEVEYYRRAEAQRRMEQDLKTIQKIDPNVKSLDELGDEYFKLIRSGISGETAFNAIRAKEGRTEKKEPPKIGAVNSKTAEEKDYYTNDELNALTSRDLDDPKVYERAMRSLGRLRP